MASALKKPIEVKDSTLVVQYEVKANNGFACDGEIATNENTTKLQQT